jgi:ribulose-bisphosphate carboxylase small chain
MRLTQGTFSYLPDLSDEEIGEQVAYCVGQGWAMAVEYTDDPHPRNVYWEMWGLPYFDVHDVEAVVGEVNRCRQTNPSHYIRLSAYDARLGRQTTALAFIVNRPQPEPDFRLIRSEGPGRTLGYTMEPVTSNGVHP